MNAPLIVAPSDPRLAWPGSLSLEITAEGHAIPWRLPHDRLSLFPSQETWGDLSYAAALLSGVRLAFASDTRKIEVWHAPTDKPRPLDVCCDGRTVATVQPDAEGRFRCDGLPAGEKRIELWLPVGARFELRGLRLSSGASLRRTTDGRLRWLAYGSSLTQAAGAASPTQTWAAIVARARDVNLTNLGFSGHCQLEPMIARLVRDRPLDALSICAGANVYDGALTRRTFRAALIGFVQIVREAHPRIPVALISPPHLPARETGRGANAAGWTMTSIREEVAAAADALREHGDRDVFYVHGPQLLGPAEARLLADGMHPGAEGYRLIGERFDRLVAPRLFAGATSGQAQAIHPVRLPEGIADVATATAESRWTEAIAGLST